MKFLVTPNGNFGLETLLKVYPAIKDYAKKNNLFIRISLNGYDLLVESIDQKTDKTKTIIGMAETKNQKTIDNLLKVLGAMKAEVKKETPTSPPAHLANTANTQQNQTSTIDDHLAEKTDDELKEMAAKIVEFKAIKAPHHKLSREKLIDWIRTNI